MGCTVITSHEPATAEDLNESVGVEADQGDSSCDLLPSCGQL